MTDRHLTDEARRRAGLEAILFLADEPVPVELLADAVETPAEVVAADLEAMAVRATAEHRGVVVRAVGGGWRMYTSPLGAEAVERWAVAGRTGRLTQAALETLAVIAYKQPIGRLDVGDIRGVNADAAIRSLVARGLVTEVGRDDGPGQAVLYGTTTAFLERLGIDTLEELPPLTDFLPEAPAPDEPELGALKEIRRRLAAGGDLERDPERDDEAMPPPRPARAEATDPAMDQLTDELDRVARNAMGRLRRAVAASEPEADEDEHDAAPVDPPEDEPRG